MPTWIALLLSAHAQDEAAEEAPLVIPDLSEAQSLDERGSVWLSSVEDLDLSFLQTLVEDHPDIRQRHHQSEAARLAARQGCLRLALAPGRLAGASCTVHPHPRSPGG